MTLRSWRATFSDAWSRNNDAWRRDMLHDAGKRRRTSDMTHDSGTKWMIMEHDELRRNRTYDLDTPHDATDIPSWWNRVTIIPFSMAGEPRHLGSSRRPIFFHCPGRFIERLLHPKTSHKDPPPQPYSLHHKKWQSVSTNETPRVDVQWPIKSLQYSNSHPSAASIHQHNARALYHTLAINSLQIE